MNETKKLALLLLSGVFLISIGFFVWFESHNEDSMIGLNGERYDGKSPARRRIEELQQRRLRLPGPGGNHPDIDEERNPRVENRLPPPEIEPEPAAGDQPANIDTFNNRQNGNQHLTVSHKSILNTEMIIKPPKDEKLQFPVALKNLQGKNPFLLQQRFTFPITPPVSPDFCDQNCDTSKGQYPRPTVQCYGKECLSNGGYLFQSSDVDNGLIYKLDFLYPLFRIPNPNFLTEHQLSEFHKIQIIQSDYIHKHSSCPSPEAGENETRCPAIPWIKSNTYNLSLHGFIYSEWRFVNGQILVLKNAIYNGNPDTSFNEHTKCAYSANYHAVINTKQSEGAEGKKTIKKAMILMTSSMESFQHFIDRGFAILMQMVPFLQADPELKIMASGIPENGVELMKRMGLHDRFIHPHHGLIEECWFACVSPHYHPWTYQKARELLNVVETIDDDKRDVVLFMTRKGQGDRDVANEAELVAEIQAFFDSAEYLNKNNNKKIDVKVWRHSMTKGLNATMELFGRAKAVIGPHGGALYNVMYCPRNTLFIEFFPVNNYHAGRWPEGFWWLAEFFGLKYYFLQEPTVFKIKPKLVTDILRKEFL